MIQLCDTNALLARRGSKQDSIYDKREHTYIPLRKSIVGTINHPFLIRCIFAGDNPVFRSKPYYWAEF